MSSPQTNPNTTAKYVTPTNITKTWRKYIIQATIANDVILNLTSSQRNKIARVYQNTYNFPCYDKPNTNGYTHNTDLTFSNVISPQFDLFVEKVKVCLHKKATYGCVKLNVWNYGNISTYDEVVPTNIIGIEGGEPSNLNVPLSIYAENDLISNALDDTDDYMILIGENTKINPFEISGAYISASSLLRFGIQYADSNAYGLKVFLICWANVCDYIGDKPSITVPEEETVASGIPPEIECVPYQSYDPDLIDPSNI